MKAYDSLSEMQKKLLGRDTIDLFGYVDNDMLNYVREAILRAMSQPVGYPDLTIYVSSEGGDVLSGLAIYDIIRNYPGKTTAVVNIYACSIAAVIMQACDVRRCMVYAQILIHNPSDHLSVDVLNDSKRLQKDRDRLNKSRDRIHTVLSQRSGQTLKRIAAICLKDTRMMAEEALKLNLIDEIIVKPVKEKINA